LPLRHGFLQNLAQLSKNKPAFNILAGFNPPKQNTLAKHAKPLYCTKQEAKMAPSRARNLLAVCAFCVFPAVVAAGTVVSVMNDPDNPNLPKDAPRDSCFAHEITPAIIEITTERTPLLPEKRAVDTKTGKTTVIQEATFDVKVAPRIVKPRKEIWFETICPQLYSERFVKSLQRALRARGFYSGKLTGLLDSQTNLAIKLYQRSQSLNSEILALSTVEALGLVPHRDFKSTNHTEK